MQSSTFESRHLHHGGVTRHRHPDNRVADAMASVTRMLDVCGPAQGPQLSVGGSAQPQAFRVGGMPLHPSGVERTPSTWWTEIPPSSNPLADAAM